MFHFMRFSDRIVEEIDSIPPNIEGKFKSSYENSLVDFSSSISKSMFSCGVLSECSDPV